jgi:hypothetical protein
MSNYFDSTLDSNGIAACVCALARAQACVDVAEGRFRAYRKAHRVDIAGMRTMVTSYAIQASHELSFCDMWLAGNPAATPVDAAAVAMLRREYARVLARIERVRDQRDAEVAARDAAHG